MADNFSNLRRAMLNYAKHPNNTDQTTCRLCKQVFRSTQALIAHIESHMEHEEVAIRRLHSTNYINSQRQLASSLFPPSFPLPMQLQATQNFSPNNSIFQSPPQPMAMPQPKMNSFFTGSQDGSSTLISQTQLSPLVLSCEGNNASEMEPLRIPQFHQRKLAEVSPIDGTRPFIVHLEKPIKNINSHYLVNMNDDDSDVESLNLVLKL